MAKKKKKKHHKGKKHRMSGAGDGSVVNFVAAVLGTVAGAYADKAVKMIPGTETLNPYWIAGGKVALGGATLLIPKKVKYRSAMQSFGAGMAGVGALNLLTQSGILSGADDPLIIDLSGYNSNMNENVLAGMDDLSVMNEDVLAGNDLSVVNGMY